MARHKRRRSQSQPPILATQPRMEAPYADTEASHRLSRSCTTRVTTLVAQEAGPDRLLVEAYAFCRTALPPSTAPGQRALPGLRDGADRRDGQGDRLSQIQTKLEPILDKSAMPRPHKSGAPDTILGYEAEGTGLRLGFEVIGAMSAQARSNAQQRTSKPARRHYESRSSEVRKVAKLYLRDRESVSGDSVSHYATSITWRQQPRPALPQSTMPRIENRSPDEYQRVRSRRRRS